MLKNAIYLSVNVFRNKLLTEDNIFNTAIFRSEPSEGLAVFRLKAVPSFLSYLKTLSIGPVPGNRIHNLPLCSRVLYRLS